ncbi:hypothetical protein [Acetatifactor aquisgranensis]|uniref:hypothetical protein n=1 Tax=Acetatifactor aquisgranensis TaxID=2941233 RepID=UPI002ED14717
MDMINGLTIGTESGDDGTLALAGKGYTAADILEQCRELKQQTGAFCCHFWSKLMPRLSYYQKATFIIPSFNV